MGAAAPTEGNSRGGFSLSDSRKRRMREHVIADLSVNHVERFILRCGWVARRMNPDYGIDLYIETYNHQGEIENEGVWFQLKATDNLVIRSNLHAIAIRMEWRDLLFWLNERMPGILVIYDALQDCACWLHLQETLLGIKRKSGRRLTHTVPSTSHSPISSMRRRFWGLASSAMPSWPREIEGYENQPCSICGTAQVSSRHWLHCAARQRRLAL
jgi:hypothetical protein